jgi:DtxR family Mn-dependent transcriptional regulator
LHIIRAHRLWERYLADETGVAENEWHGQAEDREHHLSPEQVKALSTQLGHPTHDPHGDPIPTASGAVVAEKGESLNTLAVDHPAVITHIEDEPGTIYAQIVAEGLRPGMKVRVLEKSPQAIRFWAEGDEHVLAPILANNIEIVPLVNEEIEEEPEFLSNLKTGAKARVLRLSRACRGPERRRLLDLGFVPGSPGEEQGCSLLIVCTGQLQCSLPISLASVSAPAFNSARTAS